jgi:hypothetical protein
METKISQALLKEITIRNLKDSMEILSVALDRFSNEEFVTVWKEINSMLKKIEQDVRVTRLLLQ